MSWGKDKVDPCSSYADMLPQEWIKENNYIPDRAYITTYSFDTRQLNEVLYELGLFDLIASDKPSEKSPGKLHVFYDETARHADSNEYQTVSSACLHGITLETAENVYAFHPKVIMIRYVSDTTAPGYVIIVMSKNISRSNMLEAYAVACGVVEEDRIAEKDVDSDVDHNIDYNKDDDNDFNGEELARFWEKIIDITSEYDPDTPKNNRSHINMDDELKELRKVRFVQPFSGKTVRFLEGGQVLGKLKASTEVIIVSPFLSYGFFKRINKHSYEENEQISGNSRDDLGKVRSLVSTMDSFAKLFANMKNIRKDKCIFFNGSNKSGAETGYYRADMNLHAKIYCCKMADGKAYCIVGSSNATVNGCDLNCDQSNKSGNVEFNIEFEISEDDYEGFDKLLRGEPFQIVSDEDIKMFGENAEEGVDFRRYYAEFLRQLKVETRMISDQGTDHRYEIEFAPVEAEKYSVELAICGSDLESQDIWKKLSDGATLTLGSLAPVAGVYVKIIANSNGQKEENEIAEKIFYLDLYDRWQEEAQSKLDMECRKNYRAQLLDLQKQIFNGNKVRKLHQTRKENDSNNRPGIASKAMVSRRSDRSYVYEKIMSIYQYEEDTATRTERLKELRRVTKLLDESDENDQFQHDLMLLLSKLEDTDEQDKISGR